MGNHHSQDAVPTAITSHLSNKAKTQLSEQKPGLKHLLTSSLHTKKHTLNVVNEDPYQCPTPSSTLSCRSTSTSLPSMEYTTVNGRKYINTPHSRYFLPCDEDETDRLIVLHFLLKYAFTTNYISPVRALLQGSPPDDRPKVLDIGTGAGTWILEMASEFNETDFYGIDVAPMYPSTIKPTNAHFQQHDMLDGLPFDDESMDFIFMRQMTTSVSKLQLHALLTEIARVLKPNGYLEIVDVEYQIQRPGPISSSLINKHLRDKMTTFGIEFDLCTQLSTILMTIQTKQGGFIDTMQNKITMPLGWGGQLGDLHAHNLELFLRSVNPVYTQESNPTGTGLLTEAAIQHTLTECKKYQSHLNWYAFTARKSPSLSPSPTRLRQQESASSLPYPTEGTLPPSSPPTPPLEPLEWESINSFVTGFVE